MFKKISYGTKSEDQIQQNNMQDDYFGEVVAPKIMKVSWLFSLVLTVESTEGNECINPQDPSFLYIAFRL